MGFNGSRKKLLTMHSVKVREKLCGGAPPWGRDGTLYSVTDARWEAYRQGSLGYDFMANHDKNIERCLDMTLSIQVLGTRDFAM